MSRLVVRAFRVDDLNAMFLLFRETVRRINSRDHSAEQIAAWTPEELDTEGAERWRKRFTEAKTFVAEVDAMIAGYTNVEGDGHIDHFYVSANHQGQGVGRALMAALFAVEGPELFSEVSTTARPFFEHMGFVVVEERRPIHRGVQFMNYGMRRPR